MRTLVLLLLLMPSFQAVAWSNFFENPYAPYPAGCSAVADWWEGPDGSKLVKFHEGTISLRGTNHNSAPMVIRAYRAACVEPNRSLILLQFTTPNDQTDGYYFMPGTRVMSAEGYELNMSLALEQGSWNMGNGGSAYPSQFGLDNCAGNNGFCSVYGWSFVLDNASPLYWWSSLDYLMTAEDYNNSFTLELTPAVGYEVYRIHVPPTADLLASRTSMPISGRHSGLWVVDGAPDQGFNIAISDIPPSEISWTGEVPVLFFLSWYTFDKDGNPLWLSGAAHFPYGASELSFPLVLVTDGEFASGKAASRRTVGNVTLKANSCNDLSLDYDLGELELGAGSKQLQRVFSLELAGYACRDMQARIDSQ